MPQPAIADARIIAAKHRQLGTLILSFADGRYALASYGQTRRHCDAMRHVVDQIADMLAAGDIEIPPVLGEAASGSVASDDGERVNQELLAACEAALEFWHSDKPAGGYTAYLDGVERVEKQLHAAIAKAKGE